MYLLFGILLPLLILFFIINHRRKKKIIKKICGMCKEEKCSLINGLIEPFGFSYLPSQDIFTSRIDAWQREFGYCTFYDKTAPRFQLVFDCLPVYFNYHDRTWLIQFWKGQYGINTGCEIGVYRSDRILHENEWESTLFQSVSNEEMPLLSFHFFKEGKELACLRGRHWWLTAFLLGKYSEKEDLFMHASVTLPDYPMACAFARGLVDAGYRQNDICLCCNTVSFSFAGFPCHYGVLRFLRIRLAQGLNRFWCAAYLSVTKPFYLSLDKILYLYYYLPFSFRRILGIRRYKKFRGKRG